MLGCPILRAFGEGWDVQIQSLPRNPATNPIHSGRARVHGAIKPQARAEGYAFTHAVKAAPKGLPLCAERSRRAGAQPPQMPGCPILRGFGEGWDVNRLSATEPLLLLLLLR